MHKLRRRCDYDVCMHIHEFMILEFLLLGDCVNRRTLLRSLFILLAGTGSGGSGGKGIQEVMRTQQHLGATVRLTRSLIVAGPARYAQAHGVAWTTYYTICNESKFVHNKLIYVNWEFENARRPSPTPNPEREKGKEPKQLPTPVNCMHFRPPPEAILSVWFSFDKLTAYGLRSWGKMLMRKMLEFSWLPVIIVERSSARI